MHTSAGTLPPANPEVHTSYFIDLKRGEVNELRTLLSNVKVQHDLEKYRDVIKKVLAYMTIGVDMSPLFTNMIMALKVHDIVTKKMVYFYLCNYAKSHSDLALLAVNTLQKECRDDDPMIRALALRSLCSLKIGNIVEYLPIPIKNGFVDSSVYVRVTAVIGCAKFIKYSNTTDSADWIDQLYQLIRDSDPSVVASAIRALDEILTPEGGIVINRKLCHYLLNRFNDFDAWGQHFILTIVVKYKPSTVNELFDIMNVLDSKLKDTNVAVVLATIKLFIHYAKMTRFLAEDSLDQEQIINSVYMRIKNPLLSLMSISSSSMELSYVLMSHIKLLLKESPRLFSSDYKLFFCKYFDSTFVKQLKLDILPFLATKDNSDAIVNELSEYVIDINVDVARLALRAIGKVANKISSSLLHVIDILINLLQLKMDYVSSEIIIIIKDLLRLYPSHNDDIIPPLIKYFRFIEEDEAKSAMIWILGEYGTNIYEAPYLLEGIINDYLSFSPSSQSFASIPNSQPSSTSSSLSSPCRLALLTASMKLFIKRPAEISEMMLKLLKKMIEDKEQIDIHDRALFYYRLILLSSSFSYSNIMSSPLAKVVLSSSAVSTSAFIDDETEDSELSSHLMSEFDSLSVCYNKLASSFPPALAINDTTIEQKTENTTAVSTTAANTTESTTTLSSDTSTNINAPNIPVKKPATPIPQPYTPSTTASTVLDIDDLLTSDSMSSPAKYCQLQPTNITPKEFQSAWMDSFKTTNKWTVNSNLTSSSLSPSFFENLFKEYNLFTIASGASGGTIKSYLYCKDEESSFYYFEFVHELESATITLKYHSSPTSGKIAAAILSFFQSLFNEILKKRNIIFKEEIQKKEDFFHFQKKVSLYYNITQDGESSRRSLMVANHLSWKLRQK